MTKTRLSYKYYIFTILLNCYSFEPLEFRPNRMKALGVVSNLETEFEDFYFTVTMIKKLVRNLFCCYVSFSVVLADRRIVTFSYIVNNCLI